MNALDIMPSTETNITIKPSAANDDILNSINSVSCADIPSKQILIIRWDSSEIHAISSLFKERGYSVTSCYGYQNINPADYGAIIHVARSAEILESCVSGGEISDYECVLIARDDIDDIQCTVQLTEASSTELKSYVKWLWAFCNIP